MIERWGRNKGKKESDEGEEAEIDREEQREVFIHTYTHTHIHPSMLKWRHFPIIPCFAMTTNKSQGQSFNFVGIYLPKPIFSHGQLYVALSRTKLNIIAVPV